MHESELLNGYLEPTNEPYAIAKYLGSKCVRVITDNTKVKN